MIYVEHIDWRRTSINQNQRRTCLKFVSSCSHRAWQLLCRNGRIPDFSVGLELFDNISTDDNIVANWIGWFRSFLDFDRWWFVLLSGITPTCVVCWLLMFSFHNCSYLFKLWIWQKASIFCQHFDFSSFL